MKRAVRVLRRAQRDLQQIYNYVAREAPPRADSFIDGLLDAIESLDELSERGATPRDSALRQRGYRYLRHREYLIFFKVLRRQVRVYRVVHAKRAYRHLWIRAAGTHTSRAGCAERAGRRDVLV